MSCCAPCCAGAIKQLQNNDFQNIVDFIVLFFNPNIFPESEYQKRLNEQIKYCQDNNIKYAAGEYNHERWLNAIKGFEDCPERGSRCALCFAHRFKYAQKFAAENGYNAVASVFGVSRHKSQAQVNAAAINSLSNIQYLDLGWDEKLRCEIGRESSFYRQNYCGCEFSIRKV